MDHGKKVRFPYGVMFLKISEQQMCRFAVIVPNRVHKNATKRNRMKRLVRESIHHMLPSITSVDGVVLIQKMLPDKQADVEVCIYEKIISFHS